MFIFKNCRCNLSSKALRSIRNRLKSIGQDLRLFSVKSRLELLCVLNKCNHCVNDIIAHTGMSQSLVSHHLADLANAGFIHSKRDGKFINYTLTDKGREFMNILDYLTQDKKGGGESMKRNPLKIICDCLCKCCKKCKECWEKIKERKN